MNKIIIVWLLATVACLSARAEYADHRNRRVDSLETVLQKNASLTDIERIGIYKDLMWGYLQTDGKRSVDYAQKTLALSYKIKGLNIRVNALRILGLNAYGGGDYKTALKYLEQALAVTDSMKNDHRYTEADIDDNLSSLYGTIANVYNIQDQLHLALAYYQKALPIFEKYGWMESTSICHHNIGELYLSMGNNKEAEHHYRLAVDYGRLSGDSLIVVVPLKGLAALYVGQGDYAQAEVAAKESFEYFSHHTEEENEAYMGVLVQMARIALKGHDDMGRAEALAKEAKEHIDENTGAEIRAEVYNLCCELAMEKKQWREALDYALLAVDTDTTETYNDMGTYVYLAQIYTELGEKELAKEYVAKIYNGMKQFASKHYQSGLSQMEVLYETEKKEVQIGTLAHERRLYLMLSVLAALLLLTAIIVLIYRNMAEKRKKALLTAKVALETETKERQMLAKDLHDGLGGMLSLLKLKVDSDAPKEETLRMLDSTMAELRHVAHHIMPKELLQGGLKSALRDFAISVPGAHLHYEGDDERLNQELELVLYRCAYELVNNAIKYASANHIDISLTKGEHTVTLSVSDDGKGFDATQPTTGMGLQNIRNRIAPYKGKMDITSNENQGTEIHVTLLR